MKKNSPLSRREREMDILYSSFKKRKRNLTTNSPNVFSNVSPNRFPERMHSHIGCNGLPFLRYVFSNVSSNCLPQMEHSHTCCICLSFVQGHCCRSCMQKRANALDLSSMRILRSVVSQMTSSSITGVSNM